MTSRSPHFLEHMAFNGTKHFPAGQMVEYFQRLGMGFGSHTNAHTSFNETVYKLEMPTNEIAQIDEGFTLMRDQADGMLLLANEVDKERGVIMSENGAGTLPSGGRLCPNWNLPCRTA
ncbi:MAG: insulinase family protein [Verrucomicrobiales bacterium]